jgi:ankyrin repeat protein
VLLTLTLDHVTSDVAKTSAACSDILKLAQRGDATKLATALNELESSQATELLACEGPIKRAPLHFAALAGHASAIQLLVKRGAEVDIRERFGVTALMYASMNGHTAAIVELLKQGADIKAFNHNHWTSLHYAARHEQLEAIQVLLNHGADPTAVNRRQQLTPYRMAEYFDKRPAMALLEKLGAKGEG